MSPYKQLWKVVQGSVTDAFNRHPDYLTPKGRKSAPVSITKRVTGTVLSFAVQAAKSQSSPLAENADRDCMPDQQASGDTTSDAGAGALSRQPLIHRVRIVNVRFKRRSRYRSPQSFNLTTDKLRKELGRGNNGQA